ncbi:MAG: diguanylate cyclase [Caulobacteraceae bacterium]
MTDDSLPTVMIVDDDRINRAALAELLREDCRLVLAKDGPSALQRAAEEGDLSLILLDVSMPGMDGYEVLRRLREDKRTADVSVVFITGQTDEEDEERGLLLGAADYVSKPIRPAIVRARIRNHLKLVKQHRELERLSEQDGLTGIANRRLFDKALDRASRHALRTGEPLGVAIFDVDHFKQYNDRYGHIAGDEVLRRVAQTLAASARRPYDIVARYGGEEFVLIVPAAENFELLLEQMRRAVAGLEIPHEDSSAGAILTISGGGVVAHGARAGDAAAMLARADQLLYQSKLEGRNRIRVESRSDLG